MKLFILGAVAAWVLEFLFYTFFVKKNSKQTSSTSTAVQTPASFDTSALNNKIKELENTVAACKEEQATTQAKLAGSEAKIAELEAELADKEVELQNAPATEETTTDTNSSEQAEEDNQAEAPSNDADDDNTVDADNDSTEAESVEEESTEDQQIDDLSILSGIGPKLHEALNDCGIYSFKQLIDSDIDDLTKQLKEKGARFGQANAQTWAQQAELAAQGDMKGLKALQAELKG